MTATHSHLPPPRLQNLCLSRAVKGEKRNCGKVVSRANMNKADKIQNTAEMQGKYNESQCVWICMLHHSYATFAPFQMPSPASKSLESPRTPALRWCGFLAQTNGNHNTWPARMRTGMVWVMVLGTGSRWANSSQLDWALAAIKTSQRVNEKQQTTGYRNNSLCLAV